MGQRGQLVQLCRARRALLTQPESHGAPDISALPNNLQVGAAFESEPYPNKFFHGGAVFGDDSELTNPPSLKKIHSGLVISEALL